MNAAMRSHRPVLENKMAERVGRLTQGQLECLHLVDQHLSSKEIAVELNISPHTVDQRIRGALATLGGDRRAAQPSENPIPHLDQVRFRGAVRADAFRSVGTRNSVRVRRLAPRADGHGEISVSIG